MDKRYIIHTMVQHLYIHIPFCLNKCIYCDFFSIPYDESISGAYIDALEQELIRRKMEMGEVETIYIGGGTPSVLSDQELTRLLHVIDKNLALSDRCEITVEMNPCTVSRVKVDRLIGEGVNRFSLGVQSFFDRELYFLGRLHSASDSSHAIDIIREAGVKNLSIDLLYAIPGQSLKDWTATLSKAIAISPEHISTYELTPEKGTPLHQLLYRSDGEGRYFNQCDEEAIVRMYETTIEILTDAGYIHYEISNFSKPSFECRHNLNCWDRGEYAGIGAGAHSFFQGKRRKNICDVSGYIKRSLNGDLPVEEEIEISAQDVIKEEIFLGLRRIEGIDHKRFKERHFIDILDAADELFKGGFLTENDGRIKLTRRGLLTSSSVILRLFEAIFKNL